MRYDCSTVDEGSKRQSEVAGCYDSRFARSVDPPDAAGWLTLTLQFESPFAARERILGLGGAIEVLEPEPLRQSVADFATQIVARYAR